MELYTLLIIIAVVLCILILILFPEARTLLSGFTRLFIKDMATTPEGAEAIYSEKIEQAQDAYNKADNALKPKKILKILNQDYQMSKRNVKLL